LPFEPNPTELGSNGKPSTISKFIILALGYIALNLFVAFSEKSHDITLKPRSNYHIES